MLSESTRLTFFAHMYNITQMYTSSDASGISTVDVPSHALVSRHASKDSPSSSAIAGDINEYVFTFTYTDTQKHTLKQKHTYPQTHIKTHLQKQTRTYTYTKTHTYTYT